jgi:hypothetical protein
MMAEKKTLSELAASGGGRMRMGLRVWVAKRVVKMIDAILQAMEKQAPQPKPPPLTDKEKAHIAHVFGCLLQHIETVMAHCKRADGQKDAVLAGRALCEFTTAAGESEGNVKAKAVFLSVGRYVETATNLMEEDTDWCMSRPLVMEGLLGLREQAVKTVSIVGTPIPEMTEN